MQIVVHRGTHQIGGVATEIRTESTRIIIDMSDELSLDDGYEPEDLSISGVTDLNGNCDAVLFTHNHGDHVGQIQRIRDGIPLYIGAFAKEVLLKTLPTNEVSLKLRMEQAKLLKPGEQLLIGDITITPYSVDHSACDSYMFLIEADGKRILHTGDFRLHGFRGKAIPKLLSKVIGKVDILIMEGTTLSRDDMQTITERELQQIVKGCMTQYKYVFVLCASTNLERICALAKAVPRGKYFICDEYQAQLLELIEKHWGTYSELYRDIKRTIYGENLFSRFQDKGFLMMVRDNQNFRKIMQRFDAKESILLYSMWDGYRTRPGSTIPDFINIIGRWEPLHTSGHAPQKDLRMVIEKINPDIIIPIHTDSPERLQEICSGHKVMVLNDGEEKNLERL